jgi:antitoxin (DNA-binding transcriptional repressor) of toxin-antitoxin stability system
MESIGLADFANDVFRTLARARAGSSIVLTDRGKAVLRIVPEEGRRNLLQEMIAAGEVRRPVATGLPELLVDIAPECGDLSELLIYDRGRETDRDLS